MPACSIVLAALLVNLPPSWQPDELPPNSLSQASVVSAPQDQAGDVKPSPINSSGFLASVFRIQFDQHLDAQQYLDVDPTADLTVERCEAILRRLRPGSVTVFALGHGGWARLPGTVIPPHPAMSKDALAIWREACNRTGTPLFVYISTLINNRMNNEHPQFARHYSNGGVAPQRLDHNTRFVDDYLLPFIEEIMRRYHPEGIWFDGDFWAIFPSWNPASIAAFERSTGLSAPVDFGDANFGAFWRFTIDSHSRYLDRVANLIHQYNPECAFVVNAACTLRQPATPPSSLARINMDPPVFFGMTTACLESRFQAGRSDIPFDVVLASYTEPEGCYYKYPKSDAQLTQEMATVLANGGRFTIYSGMSRTGGFALENTRRLHHLLEDFCLPRKACFVDSVSVPDVAVLHTRDHFESTHRLDEVRGAALALLRSNSHFDILDDETFRLRGSEYGVVVVPEQGSLSPTIIQELDRFVRRGGGLVISLPSGLDAASHHVQAGLNGILPIGVGESMSGAGRMSTPAGPTGVQPGWFTIRAASSDVTADMEIQAHSDAGEKWPGRLRYSLGKGRVVLFSAPVFDTYGMGPDPRLAKVIAHSIAWAAGEKPRLQVSAPAWLEVVRRTTGRREIIHLVNHARGNEFRPRASVVEHVPPVRDVLVELPLSQPPQKVTLIPEGVELEVIWEHGVLSVRVPEVKIHTALIVDRAPVENAP